MRQQVLFYLKIFAGIYVMALGIATITVPTYFSNILGLLSVMSYILSLIPGILKVILPSAKKNTVLIALLKHRRFLGVAAFMLALNHGALQFIKENINLLESSTYIHYFQGLTMMVIMTILAATSSDESVKAFKKNWKKIHKLTYLIIFLLPWHIVDKMSNHWTFVTPIALLLSTILLSLFLFRFYKERQATIAKYLS
ncbi:MAG: iron reductase [Acaryochloridaceae cyanobacterium SU_2_1]|nr:iron reductase [Acaryochloridaceae cyanobacterium SU_2_1]